MCDTLKNLCDESDNVEQKQSYGELLKVLNDLFDVDFKKCEKNLKTVYFFR